MNARCQRVNLTSRWTRSHDIKCFLKDSIWHPNWGKWVQWYLTSETVFLFASCFLQPTPRNLGDQKKEEAISLLRQIPLWQLLPSFFSFPIKKMFLLSKCTWHLVLNGKKGQYYECPQRWSTHHDLERFAVWTHAALSPAFLSGDIFHFSLPVF